MSTVTIQRDQYGRPLLPDPLTKRRKPWTRVTTLASTIQDRRALEQWSQRNLVKGFVANETLLLRAAAAGDDRSALDEVIRAAMDAARASDKADMGTAVHAITEKIDRGEPVVVPADYQADIKAYKQCILDHGVIMIPEFIETMTINPDLGAAGTPDRIVRMPGYDKPMIFDLKTGHNAIRYSLVEIAAQMAIYAWATHYYDGKLHPMPDVDRDTGIILHLPVGTGQANLLSVDLRIGRQIASLCHEVRQWRHAENISKPLRPGGSFSDEEVRRRVDLIKDALGDKPLPMAWPDGIPTPSRRTEPYEPSQAAAIGAWCVFVEGQLDLVPF
jgi:hypothetical protein